MSWLFFLKSEYAEIYAKIPIYYLKSHLESDDY